MRVARGPFVVAALAVVVAAGVAGIFSINAAVERQRAPVTPVAGTLTGQLILVGGPAPGRPRGLPGTIITKGPGGRRLIATDKSGSFTVQLQPGRYSVSGRSPLYDAGNTECQPATQVIVRPSRIERADVYCQAA